MEINVLALKSANLLKNQGDGMSKETSFENIENFKKLIRDIQFCMFTTTSLKDGALRSRPMTLLEVDENEEMWFFADVNCDLVSDISENPQVNITFAHPSKSSYVSIIGQALRIESREKIKDLFTPAAKAWFPDGPDDKNLVLVMCRIESVDFWDSPSSTAVQLFAFAKAVIKGERPGDELGVHKHVDVRPH